jgi:hypothetical protein
LTPSRLAKASDALKRIEAKVVGIPKNAPVEQHILAASVLSFILGSADQIRTKESGFQQDWEETLYRIHAKGTEAPATLGHSHALVDQSRALFR